MAIMRDNTTWELAIIMEVRNKPAPDSDDEDYAETTHCESIKPIQDQNTQDDLKEPKEPKDDKVQQGELKAKDIPNPENSSKLELSHHRSEEGVSRVYEYYVNYL